MLQAFKSTTELISLIICIVSMLHLYNLMPTLINRFNTSVILVFFCVQNFTLMSTKTLCSVTNNTCIFILFTFHVSPLTDSNSNRHWILFPVTTRTEILNFQFSGKLDQMIQVSMFTKQHTEWKSIDLVKNFTIIGLIRFNKDKQTCLH